MQGEVDGGVSPALPAGPAPADMANTTVNKAEGPGLNWTAPAHWQSRPAVAMRKATYAVPGENGAAGDLLAEIQIVLPTQLNDADRVAIRQIDQHYSQDPRKDLRW